MTCGVPTDGFHGDGVAEGVGGMVAGGPHHQQQHVGPEVGDQPHPCCRGTAPPNCRQHTPACGAIGATTDTFM